MTRRSVEGWAARNLTRLFLAFAALVVLALGIAVWALLDLDELRDREQEKADTAAGVAIGVAQDLVSACAQVERLGQVCATPQTPPEAVEEVIAEAERGPAGERGLPGPLGRDGVQGDPGSAGPSGEPGRAGVDGQTGGAGTSGSAGVPGPRGVDGPQGPAGPAGPSGDPGADSTQPGPAGPAGQDGTDGTDGTDGAPGSPGAAGPAGQNGQAPESFTFTDSAGRTYRCTDADPPDGNYDCQAQPAPSPLRP